MEVLLAEEEGFEPSVPVKAHSLSRRAHSTALAPLLKLKIAIEKRDSSRYYFHKATARADNFGISFREMIKIAQKKSELRDLFERAGVPRPDRTALQLLSSLLGCNWMEVDLDDERQLSAKQVRALDQMAHRIATREPLQYVVGQSKFREIVLKSDPRALIPRPETELLVRKALEILRKDKNLTRVADVGTGSGCIVISLAKEFPAAKYSAIELCRATLSLAKENAELNGVCDKISWQQGSLLQGWPSASLDLIISNPPYIPTRNCRSLAPEIREHEPLAALDGGWNGLALIEPLVEEAKTVLTSGGWISMEIGDTQGSDVKEILRQNGFYNLELKRDYAKHDRIISAQIG